MKGRSPGEGTANSSILSWEISCTEEPVHEAPLAGCRPWGRKRVGHDLVIKQQQQLIKQLIILKNAIFLGHTDIHLIALLVNCNLIWMTHSCMYSLFCFMWALIYLGNKMKLCF